MSGQFRQATLFVPPTEIRDIGELYMPAVSTVQLVGGACAAVVHSSSVISVPLGGAGFGCGGEGEGGGEGDGD
eukprot:SAG31_NODE_1008_length_10407_cov_2.369131_4_plen_73_part_00